MNQALATGILSPIKIPMTGGRFTLRPNLNKAAVTLTSINSTAMVTNRGRNRGLFA